MTSAGPDLTSMRAVQITASAVPRSWTSSTSPSRRPARANSSTTSGQPASTTRTPITGCSATDLMSRSRVHTGEPPGGQPECDPSYAESLWPGRGSVATAVSTRERRRSELWASWAPAAGRLAATPTARRRESRSLRWRDVLARPFRHEAAAPRARRDPGLGRSRCSPCRSPAGSASSSTSAESAGPPSRSEPGHPRCHAKRPRPVRPPLIRCVSPVHSLRGQEFLDIVALPESTPGPSQTLYAVSTTGLNHGRHPPPAQHSNRRSCEAAARWTPSFTAQLGSVPQACVAMGVSSPLGHRKTPAWSTVGVVVSAEVDSTRTSEPSCRA